MDFPKRWRADKPVRFRVTVQARSAEALSPVYIFDVAWDGQWSDDTATMRRHMVVRQVDR